MPDRPRLGLILIAFLCFAQQPEGPRILRPADRSILPPAPLSVIARTAGTGELKLDGKSVKATQPAPGVLTTTLTPSPGKHELTLVTAGSEQRIQFQVGAVPAPLAGWKPYRSHPPSATCDTCHTVTGGKWSIKGDVAGPNCLGCHDAKTFPLAHSHTTDVLEECQLCHDPHGSTAKFNLKMPKEVACKQCHG
jgi:predicted CXXCH cytochrome family protein